MLRLVSKDAWLVEKAFIFQVSTWKKIASLRPSIRLTKACSSKATNTLQNKYHSFSSFCTPSVPAAFSPVVADMHEDIQVRYCHPHSMGHSTVSIALQPRVTFCTILMVLSKSHRKGHFRSPTVKEKLLDEEICTRFSVAIAIQYACLPTVPCCLHYFPVKVLL